MGIQDRIKDWDNPNNGKKLGGYKPEQPPKNGYVLSSITNLKTKERFYQKTYFKFLIIILIIIIIMCLYYIFHS